MKNLKEYINESTDFVDTLASKFKIPRTIVSSIARAIINGYIPMEENGKHVRYGFSRENISSIIDCAVDIDNLTQETLDKIIKEFESEGKKFRFEKDAEWKKFGYLNPRD